MTVTRFHASGWNVRTQSLGLATSEELPLPGACRTPQPGFNLQAESLYLRGTICASYLQENMTHQCSVNHKWHLHNCVFLGVLTRADQTRLLHSAEPSLGMFLGKGGTV